MILDPLLKIFNDELVEENLKLKDQLLEAMDLLQSANSPTSAWSSQYRALLERVNKQ
jgi:hypothetical protein